MAANPDHSEHKVRVHKDDWRQLQLYCSSGVLSVSATEILRALLQEFIDEVVLQEPTAEFDPEVVISGIRIAVARAVPKIEAKRAGQL